MFTVDEEYRIGLLEALGLEYIILSSEDGHVMWLSLDEVRDELPVLEREELVTPLVVQKIRHLLEALPLSSSVDEVVTKRYGVAEAQTAIDDLKARKGIKLAIGG